MQTGEVGELAECFQWKGEVDFGLAGGAARRDLLTPSGFSDAEKIHVGEVTAGW